MDKIQNKTRSPHHKRLATLSKSSSSDSAKELDFLPDGSHISPLKLTIKKNEEDGTAVREADYVGSFCVVGEDQNARAEHVRKKLGDFQDNVQKSKPVLLVISLSGIKVCSHTGESVYMAHALKRISYATCDPDLNQFSFLAREPKSHSSTQYCHAFITKTAEEAEELNTIVGNAFRMAYTMQREQEQRYINVEEALSQTGDDYSETEPTLSGSSDNNTTPNAQETKQPTFHELIEQQIVEQRVKNEEYQQQQQDILRQRLNRISTPNIEEQLKERKERRQKEKEDLEKEMAVQRMEGKTRMTWAKHVAQKAKHRSPLTDMTDGGTSSRLNHSQPSTSSSSDSTGTPRFHSIIELREAMDSGSLRDYGSPVMTLKETIDNHCDFSSPGARAGGSSNGHMGGNLGDSGGVHYPAGVREVRAEVHTNHENAVVDMQKPSYMMDRPLPETPGNSDPLRRSKGKGPHKVTSMSRDSSNGRSRSHSGSRTRNGFDSSNKRLSGKYQNDSSPMHSRSNSSGSEIPEEGDVYQGAGKSLRYDSVRRLDPRDLPIEEELKNASWYQHGVPREIALEILTQQEIGSFIVRDSTTHPGCYALSVKVPKFDNPVGISHYLIVRDPKNGVRLKGLDKVWPNLTALVTHHTVMPEMLPCTLRLPRTANNPLYRERDDDKEENYQKITDFSGMVQEMKI